MEDSTNQVTIRLFVGCHLNSEMRMHLNRSHAWKQAAILRGAIQDHELQDVHFHNKDYLGLYLNQETLTLAELGKMKEFITSRLKSYCPNYPPASPKIYVFPQVFVA